MKALKLTRENLFIAENLGLGKLIEAGLVLQGRGHYTFIRLQQRLLSNPEAFARTLEAHARAVMDHGGPVVRKDIMKESLNVMLISNYMESTIINRKQKTNSSYRKKVKHFQTYQKKRTSSFRILEPLLKKQVDNLMQRF